MLSEGQAAEEAAGACYLQATNSFQGIWNRSTHHSRRFERIVQTLDQVIQKNEYNDLLFVNILTARLDLVPRRGWEEVLSAKEQDTLEDLFEFLSRQAHFFGTNTHRH